MRRVRVTVCAFAIVFLAAACAQDELMPLTETITPAPTLTLPASTDGTPDASAFELLVNISPAAATAGRAIVIDITTAPAALVSIEILLPGGEALTLEERRTGTNGVERWDVAIPAGTPAGTAAVMVKAAVVGQTVGREATFEVGG